jgi:hypothetical protein
MNYLEKFGTNLCEARQSTCRKSIEKLSLHSNQQEFEL